MQKRVLPAHIPEREMEFQGIGLNGQRLLGAPLLIQPTQSEKNRAASGAGMVGAPGFAPAAMHGPMKLYVGSLHFNITEEMMKGIFDPFGRVRK